jgi:hypothetical protein
MKKILISICLAIVLSTAFAIAQNADNGKISFAVLGGVNFQNLNGKDVDGDKLENGLLTAFHAGVNVQIPIAPEFFFQPGLLFAGKGAKNFAGSPADKHKISYIELPLNVVYKPLLGKGHLLLGAGPYVAYAIGGKGTLGNNDVDMKFQSTIEATDPDGVLYYKAFDAGANIFAGYELEGGIFVQLDTQLGMLKINPEDKRISSDKSSIKNTGFGLSIGYRF